MKILLVEDDAQTAAYVAKGLAENGHRVEVAADGRDGLRRVGGEPFDLLVVDRMLPQVDGLTLVRMLREGGVETPVLFLTALGGVEDRVQGLDAGGDDYLPKPFALQELLARVNALARRAPRWGVETTLEVADLHLDLLKRIATRQGRALDLQPREFKLLEYLVRHAGQVVTRKMLLEQVWEFHFDPRTNVVETHVSRLRAKVDRPFDRPLIHTIRGSGYCLRAED